MDTPFDTVGACFRLLVFWICSVRRSAPSVTGGSKVPPKRTNQFVQSASEKSLLPVVNVAAVAEDDDLSAQTMPKNVLDAE